MTPVSGVIFLILIALGVHLTTFYTKSFQDFCRIAGLVLATWSLQRHRRQIDEIIAKIYKINYKNRYFPFPISAEVLFAPAETSAVALGRPTRYRITSTWFHLSEWPTWP